jgi:hypothetical protein
MANPYRPNAKPLAELIAPALDPVIRKRGLARAELLAWWPDIVGEAYAGRTLPERIRWPRDGRAATLIIKCDPSLALQLSYETSRIRERLNSYLGYQAIGAVKIVQHPVGSAAPARRAEQEPSPEAAARLEARLGPVEGPLRESLLELGRRVIARS